MQTTWIYCLKDPRTDAIRYVGKSDNPEYRFKKHLISSKIRTDHRAKWIGLLRDCGAVPILEKLDEVPVDSWQEIEMEYIRVFRAIGLNLTNWSDGGESPMSCKTHSMETRAKMCAASKHRPMSLENKIKLRASIIGRPRTKEHCDAISRSKKAHPEQSAHLLRLNASRIGKPLPAEQRAKIGAAGRGLKRSMITRERIRVSKLGNKHRCKK